LEEPPATLPDRDRRVVRLGRAASEPIAHLLAQAIEGEGLGVRVAGLGTIASQIVPGSSQHTIEVLVYEDEYESAKAAAWGALDGATSPETRRTCHACGAEMDGSGRGDHCPACGGVARDRSGSDRGFTFDPAPGSGSLIRNPGALLGLLVLAGLPASCVGYVVYQLILGFTGEG
jgi:hypothetical protein